MASNVRVVMSDAGSRELLNSRECQEMLLEHARRVRASCPAMIYACDVEPGDVRAHAMVKTVGSRGAEDNARTNRLLKAILGVA